MKAFPFFGVYLLVFRGDCFRDCGKLLLRDGVAGFNEHRDVLEIDLSRLRECLEWIQHADVCGGGEVEYTQGLTARCMNQRCILRKNDLFSDVGYSFVRNSDDEKIRRAIGKVE